MLTVDRTIQAVLGELDQAMAQYQPENVLAIAMDPRTGEILGMGSRPPSGPTAIRKPIRGSITGTCPSENLRTRLHLQDHRPGGRFGGKQGESEGAFFRSGICGGGSALALLEERGHGSQLIWKWSSTLQPRFCQPGLRPGKDTLFKYIRLFGFGRRRIDLSGEAGNLFAPDRIGPVELATTAFGQGVSVTPIQQVTAVSAAINGGKLMEPHLAKAWIDPKTGKVVKEIPPRMKRRVISEETSRQVRRALESVVARGTGRKAFIDGYRVGGKTGTAQKVGPNGRYLPNNHIVSFIGFAADDPRIVVYVAVDNRRASVRRRVAARSRNILTILALSGGEKRVKFPERVPTEEPM